LQSWAFGAAKIGVAALLIWLVLRKVDLHHAVLMAAMLAPAAGAAAFGLLLLQAIVSAWRWMVLSRRAGAEISYTTAFKFFMLSQFYNQALPSFIPGDACRVWGAARSGGVQRATVGVLLDRLVTLMALAFLACLSLGLLGFRGRGETMLLPLLALTGMVAGFGIVTAFVVARDRLALLLPAKAVDLVTSAGQAIQDVFHSGQVPVLFAVSLFIHGLSIATIYVLAESIQLPITLWETGIAVPVVMLAAQIPVTVNGWGVREGMMILVLAGFGIGRTEAATLSVIFGLFQLVLGLVGGLFALFPDRSADAKAARETP
jgi:uncharacterized membrane protein YbhN (UPF0104 family)